MADTEHREPETSEAAAAAEVGEAQRLADDAMVRRAAGPPPDYDAREEEISEIRKPMGPPLGEDDTTGSAAREVLDDEDSVDPA